MPDRDTALPPVPESRAIPKKKTRLSLVWVIPIVAALIGVWVAVTRILSEGPTITIVFKSAEGLEAGKTKIHYNGVEVGTLTAIRLSDDHQRVITTAQMAPKTDGFLVDDTTFWVVSPRISGANVTGLGSLDTGTPIYFRRLQVGKVASYELDKDGKALTLEVFVDAPYDQYVNPNTRFWQASGVDVSLTASGLSVQTQSLLSILVGGIAFETPGTAALLPAAEANTVFTLFSDRASAFKLPARFPQTYLLVFTDSVRGLAPGAPVEFRGIRIGEVTEVRAQVDLKTFEFSVPVTILVDPQSLGVQVVEAGNQEADEVARRKLIETFVAHGARAQLRTGNLLTGALYVSFDFYPDLPPVTVDWSQKPVQLPTTPGDIQAIEASVVSIIKKLDQVPYKAIGDDLQGLIKKLDQVPYKGIGDDLQKAIADFDQTLASARGTLNNADKLIEPNSVLGAELGNTLQEVSRAARGLRVLADYLERHPEALIRGKTGEAK
jgi:paraquat-inducible protein B